ncbi:hypothetical protein AVEN_115271-1 [Araneus ventricosus]|uniref:Uncharacterized protein n=1 Tax=Araneus ventricosus TaxID=182803 RepID=A0A4Y1ZXW9_ARAVE|nr:hypothetical protein AVEN_115271-1 [Araneus ventricosus]
MARESCFSKEEIEQDVNQKDKRNKGKADLATKAKERSFTIRHPSNSCLPATRIAKENGIKASISNFRRKTRHKEIIEKVKTKLEAGRSTKARESGSTSALCQNIESWASTSDTTVSPEIVRPYPKSLPLVMKGFRKRAKSTILTSTPEEQKTEEEPLNGARTIQIFFEKTKG